MNQHCAHAVNPPVRAADVNPPQVIPALLAEWT
jgi:hypothetical protein